MLVTRTNEAFTQVAESAAKVGELVAEIAAASNEQSQGIGQVNIAVTEMDRVTQQNAATAGESANASAELNAQAERMKSMVADLMTLVGGGGDGPAPVFPAKKAKGKINVVHHEKEMSSEKLIPLNDDGFQAF